MRKTFESWWKDNGYEYDCVVVRSKWVAEAAWQAGYEAAAQIAELKAENAACKKVEYAAWMVVGMAPNISDSAIQELVEALNARRNS